MGKTLRTVIVASVALLSACTLSETPAPPLQGPSELGLSLTTFANPDVLSQDGASQSLIVVQAYDTNGQPARNVSFRVEITVGGVVTDFGSLSARTLVTGNDGRATVTYTAPPPPLVSVDTNSSVTIRLTPSEGNFADAQSRFVQIRLVPPGVIIGPTGPRATFTVSPATPAAFSNVTFDASASTPGPNAIIVSYDWNFGDGSTASGPVALHQFAAGSYSVTLTVTDSSGASASTSKAVNVAAGTLPTATIDISPTLPLVNQTIFFNASRSVAGAGRTIVRYDWNFGSGTPQSGVTVTKSYDVPGTYAVVLTVTDDVGQRNTAEKDVTVAAGTASVPTARFTLSPSPARTGEVVMFNASASSSTAGATIARYEWDFGDGSAIQSTTAPNATIQHIYTQQAPKCGPCPSGQTDGRYTIRLTVFDTNGLSNSTTATLLVY